MVPAIAANLIAVCRFVSNLAQKDCTLLASVPKSAPHYGAYIPPAAQLHSSSKPGAVNGLR